MPRHGAVSLRLIALGLFGLLTVAGGALWYFDGGSHSDRDVSQGHTSPVPATEQSNISEALTLPPARWGAAGLRVEPAIAEPLDEAITLTGKIALNEDRLAHIFPLVEGRVETVKVQLGQPVKQGELLVVVQSKEVGQGMLQLFQDRLKLEYAEAKNRWTQDVSKNTLTLIEMLRSGAKIEAIEAALKDRTLGDAREQLMTAYIAHFKAQAHLQRLSPLSDSGAVPARQILEAEAELNATRAGLQSLLEQAAQDAVQASRISAQTIRELQTSIAVSETNLKILGFTKEDLAAIDPSAQGARLAHYPVFAPFDGTVISKDVVLLERVGPDRQIMAIADLRTVWVTADIYEAHLPLLARLADQTIRLHCDAWPAKPFEAKIFYTGDVLEESTRTIALRAVADNPEGILKPGMFVNIELPALNAEAVVQTPQSAVLDHEGQSFLFVQTGPETFERRDVTLGRRNRRVVEIRSGIAAGERVVVDGGFALKSKMLAALLAE